MLLLKSTIDFEICQRKSTNPDEFMLEQFF